MALIGAAFSRSNINNLHFLNRLTAVKDAPPDDSVSRTEHETTREQLEGEVSHLTQLLQGALRKQDEMALEAADAWQKVRKKRSRVENERSSRDEKSFTSSCNSQPFIRPPGAGESRRAGGPAGAGGDEGDREPDADLQAGRVPGCCESAQTAGGEPRSLREGEEQEGESSPGRRSLLRHGTPDPVTLETFSPVSRNHAVDVCPCQIDDLSREVGKLKDALNSLSQLSYSSGSPSKRLQQNQQLETMQQQVKQLQYQLAVRPLQRVSEPDVGRVTTFCSESGGCALHCRLNRS